MAALVHELFEERARRTPDATAVVSGAERLGYGELNRRANRLARALRARGAGPDAVVGVWLERSPRMVIAMLAALKAGAAYLPLDTDHPDERLGLMVADAGAGLVVADAAGERWAAELVAVDCAGDESDLEPLARGANLAYVIYTSGSTGTPKGVMVAHDSLRDLVDWHVDAFAVTADDRASQVASPAFDAAVWEVWPYLCAGTPLHLADTATRSDPRALRDWLLASGVTVAFAATPLAEQLLDLAWPSDAPLRLLLTGADRLRRYPPSGLPFALVNNYGPTETTVVATSGEVVRGPELPSIGRAIAGASVAVLDAELRPVPDGEVGELCVAGAGLARGYRGRPGLTAERFVPAPGGTRLYRTGDRARVLANGELEYVGREDQQVEVRGHRIELGEVEAALEAHPAVERAVVAAREPVPGDVRLVAYVVPSGADAGALREHLRARLPEPMLPAAFVGLDALPLTASGKVDRRALPDPEWEEGDAYEAPRTVEEEVLAWIGAEVLGRRRLGRQDDFFELGGHSLLGAQVMSRVESVLGVELPLSSLFERPTIAGLGALIEEARREGAGGRVPALRATQRAGELPLSFAQERLWLLCRLAPESPYYNVPIGLRLRGDLDVPALERALTEIVRRHSSQRTRFVEREGAVVQEVLDPAPFALPVEDVGSDEEERARCEAEARGLFDLESGGLLRGRLLRRGAREHVLVLVMHHVVSDGWSLGVLVRELGELYAGRTLPELEVQYGDYAVWQRGWLQGDELERQLAYWRDRLAGVEMLELAGDRVRPAVQSHRGGTRRVELGAELTARLRALSRAEGVTLFMTLLAGFQVLLGRYTGQRDVAVGSPVANRRRVELEGLLGFFVNTLVMRTDLGGRPSFREVLGRVREVALGAYAHQDLPFEKLVAELSPDRDLSRSPLFQVLFQLHNEPGGDLEMAGLDVSPLPLGTGTAKFDLALSLTERGDHLEGTLEYSADLFEPATVDRLVAHLRVLLAAAVDRPETEIGELDLLGEGDRRLLARWNRTEGPYPSDRRVPDLFEERVRERPDAVAVVCGDERLTYGQLNREANRLARHLRRLGAGPERIVGIWMERSPRLAVAMLGVLKSGAAYLPLDPELPDERLAVMARDAGAVLVVTDGRRGTRWGAELVPLDDASAESIDDPAPAGCSENLAYVFCTSGSTGRPKPVAGIHRALLNYLTYAIEEYGLGPDDAVLNLASFGFDPSLREFFTPLLSGGRVVIARGDERSEPVAFRRILDEQGVTVVPCIMPSNVRNLVASGLEPARRLRLLMTGGEPLPGMVAEDVTRLLADRLVNQYGPTECTMVVATHPCGAPGEADESVLPLGRPIRNARVHVLDDELRRVPVGVAGEVYVSGAGVVRGYLGRPGMTAERFLPDPFASGPGGRLYRTGDLARWRADGELEFMGRRDGQVKVRGYRVEVGEVEAALSACPGVTHAVAVLDRTQPGNRLVAYLVSDSRPTTAELRSALLERLPEYMVPALFLYVDELPLTATGKLNRRALSELSVERAQAGLRDVAPRNPTEAGLADIWTNLLGLETVGVTDSFFALGGNSLLATQMISRIRRVFGREVPLRVAMQPATIADLATYLDRTPAELEPAGLPPIRPRGR